MATTYTQGVLLNPNIISEDMALKLYNKALSLLAEGITYMEFQGEGTNFSAQFPIPVAQMLSEASYCLMQKNPDKYGNICTQLKPVFV